MNPIFIDLGFIQIYWYSFIMLIAFILGGSLAMNEARKEKVAETFMVDMFFYLIPISLIGARLYYVAFEWEYYSANLLDILKVWEGGLAIHGGIIASLLFLCYYCRKKRVNFYKIADILVVSLILGQAIGRWGNFFNSEAHGAITTLESLQKLHLPDFIIKGMYINGNYYQPTFLYESVWNFIGFIALYFIRNIKNIKLGQTTALYLIWYGIGRVVIEGMRTDSLMLGDIRIAQVISIIMIVFGAILLLKGIYSNNYHEREDKKCNTIVS